MADTDTTEETPQTPERKSPAQKAAERKTLEVADAERGPLDLLREQAGKMGVAVLIVTVILLVVVYRSDVDQEFNAEAWRELTLLRDSAPSGDEGYEDLYKKYKATQAAPFIRLAWASRLYGTGLRPKVEQAKTIYQDLVKENSDNYLIKRWIPERIEEIDEELASDHAPLLDAVVGPELPVEDDAGLGNPEGTLEEAPEDEVSEDPQAPTDDPHAGHDHAPGAHGQ